MGNKKTILKKWSTGKKVAVGAAITAATLVGAYALYKTGALNSITSKIGKKSINDIILNGGADLVDLPKEKSEYSEILHSVNPLNDHMNCPSTTAATIGRFLGKDVSAKSSTELPDYTIGDVCSIFGLPLSDGMGEFDTIFS